MRDTRTESLGFHCTFVFHKLQVKGAYPKYRGQSFHRLLVRSHEAFLLCTLSQVHNSWAWRLLNLVFNWNNSLITSNVTHRVKLGFTSNWHILNWLDSNSTKIASNRWSFLLASVFFHEVIMSTFPRLINTFHCLISSNCIVFHRVNVLYSQRISIMLTICIISGYHLPLV